MGGMIRHSQPQAALNPATAAPAAQNADGGNGHAGNYGSWGEDQAPPKAESHTEPTIHLDDKEFGKY